MTAPKLKPCPFCGETSGVAIYGPVAGGLYYPQCETEGCPMSRAISYGSLKYAIDAWNRRAKEKANG